MPATPVLRGLEMEEALVFAGFQSIRENVSPRPRERPCLKKQAERETGRHLGFFLLSMLAQVSTGLDLCAYRHAHISQSRRRTNIIKHKNEVLG